MTNKQFVKSLTRAERKYLWAHVHRYDGVEGISAKEHFQQLVLYVLNFLTEDSGGESKIELKLYNKALKAFE